MRTTSAEIRTEQQRERVLHVGKVPNSGLALAVIVSPSGTLHAGGPRQRTCRCTARESPLNATDITTIVACLAWWAFELALIAVLRGTFAECLRNTTHMALCTRTASAVIRHKSLCRARLHDCLCNDVSALQQPNSRSPNPEGGAGTALVQPSTCDRSVSASDVLLHGAQVCLV